jgi:hypothetical protein
MIWFLGSTLQVLSTELGSVLLDVKYTTVNKSGCVRMLGISTLPVSYGFFFC